MNRGKLRRLGIELPLLPTTTVGSLPKPPELLAARATFRRGRISQRELDSLTEEATLFWLERQREIGLDVLVDGELYRGDMVAYFAEALEGMVLGGLVRSYGNRYYPKPVIQGAVRWLEPITVGWWRFASTHADAPVKAIVTGPYTMMDWSFDEHYTSREEACLAFAVELRNEVAALAAAGARLIQIDEPALSARPAELPTAIEALRILTEGIDAYFVAHACYGAFETIYPALLDLPVDNLDLAISHSAVDWLEMFAGQPFTKDLSVGVLDVHDHRIETAPQVVSRLRAALRLVSPEALWISPDCGLKTRTVDEATDKLRSMTAATARLRGEP